MLSGAVKARPARFAGFTLRSFRNCRESKTAWAKFGGYINHDTEPSRSRIFVFGPPETSTCLDRSSARIVHGIEGAISTRSRGLGGSDHTSFNQAGLPGIGANLDPIEYGTHTWHTNLDTYERVIEADLQQAAIVIAATVYQLAMADQLLPRFPADKMPPAPPARN